MLTTCNFYQGVMTPTSFWEAASNPAPTSRDGVAAINFRRIVSSGLCGRQQPSAAQYFAIYPIINFIKPFYFCSTELSHGPGRDGPATWCVSSCLIVVHDAPPLMLFYTQYDCKSPLRMVLKNMRADSRLPVYCKEGHDK